jgi:hypothetical protein
MEVVRVRRPRRNFVSVQQFLDVADVGAFFLFRLLDLCRDGIFVGEIFLFAA